MQQQQQTFLFSQSIADKYKEVSEVINSVEPTTPKMRPKTIKAMMQQSFFHGASWMGQNFIA